MTRLRSFAAIAVTAALVACGSSGDGEPEAITTSKLVRTVHPSGAIALTVPEDWQMVTRAYRPRPKVNAPGMVLGPRPDAWLSGWGSPGVSFGASKRMARRLGLQGGGRPAARRLRAWLRETKEPECTLVGVEQRASGPRPGYVATWRDCGAAKVSYYDGRFMAPDGSWMAFLNITAITPGDHVLAQRLFDTFEVIPEELRS